MEPLTPEPATTEHVITDSDSALKRKMGAALAIFAVLAVLGFVGWAAFALLGGSDDDGDGLTIDRDESATTIVRPTTTESAVSPEDPVPPTEPAPTPTPVVPPDLLLADPTFVVDAFRQAVGGPFRAIELVLYPTYAFLDYQDPAAPTHIDSRGWRDGVVDEAEPVSLPSGFDAEVEADLFDPAEVRFDLIPSLVAQSIASYPTLENPAATHVIIDRFRPFDDRVNIRVYVSDPDRGGGGYVRFLADGTYVDIVG